MFPVISPVADRKRKSQKLTCTTCDLKHCVGRCHWEFADRPKPKKGKAV